MGSRLKSDQLGLIRASWFQDQIRINICYLTSSFFSRYILQKPFDAVRPAFPDFVSGGWRNMVISFAGEGHLLLMHHMFNHLQGQPTNLVIDVVNIFHRSKSVVGVNQSNLDKIS